MVSHTHTATVTDPGHTHNYFRDSSSNWAGGGNVGLIHDLGATTATTSSTTGITVANSTEGVSATNANLPPYYALAYIMKA